MDICLFMVCIGFSLLNSIEAAEYKNLSDLHLS